MPEITRFYGIVIRMFFQQAEHNPPHVHAIYGDYVAEFNIETGEILEGELPQKAVKLVQEWIDEHRQELLQIWQSQEFHKISPLE